MNKFDKGDMVRVVQSGGGLGDTVYRVSYANWPACQIEERRVDGTFCAPQAFDQSLLAFDPDTPRGSAPPVTSDVPVPAPKRKRAPRGSRPPRPPSRAQRWADAVKEIQDALQGLEEAAGKLEDAAGTLYEIQQEFSEWKDNLDGKFEGSALVEKLDAVCELGIEDMHSSVMSAVDEAKGVADECEGIDLPMGFGRD